MKKSLFLAATLLPALLGAQAETVNIDGTEYTVDRLQDEEVCPGVQHLRLRFPDIPVNVNLVMVDMTNPNVRVEQVPAKGLVNGKEKLADAAARMTTEGHKAVVGQNTNFWVVPPATDNTVYSGVTRSLSLVNGKLATECNMVVGAFGGPVTATGLLGITEDNDVYIDFARPSLYYRIGDSATSQKFYHCNKGVENGEVGLYNAFYGTEKAFKLVDCNEDTGAYSLHTADDGREVLMDLAEGETWRDGEWITFDVKEVRDNAGHGTLGDYDAALVGRGSGTLSRRLTAKVGDKVQLKYDVTFLESTGDFTGKLAQGTGGNLLTLRYGEILPGNFAGSYDANTYARSMFGVSEDHKTLYMMVVDKSTDPVYGKSKGFSTSHASQVAKHFGCYNMLECDGGGSAQMLIGDKVINKTTESTPRAVAAMLMVFQVEPSGIEDVKADKTDAEVVSEEIYSLTGRSMGMDRDTLAPGIYVARQLTAAGPTAQKFVVR